MDHFLGQTNPVVVENKATFFARLQSRLSPSEVVKVRSAYYLAKYGHRAQTRKGEIGTDGSALRYFEHVRRVAIILMDIAGVYDPDMICAALLHDAIEDCSEDLDAAMIEQLFGSRVARLVICLSKTSAIMNAGPDAYTKRLWDTIKDNSDVVLLKACDRLDNLKSLGMTTREFQEKQYHETCIKYMPLFRHALITEHPAITTALICTVHDLAKSLKITDNNNNIITGNL